jgi:hypothetical protein
MAYLGGDGDISRIFPATIKTNAQRRSVNRTPAAPVLCLHWVERALEALSPALFEKPNIEPFDTALTPEMFSSGVGVKRRPTGPSRIPYEPN